MTRPEALTAARQILVARFPRARQAWLSGSVVSGGATDTSDLDITVLLDEALVHRESLIHEGWPAELFVHTESSVRSFVAKDVARRRPTMARLVATGVPLLEGDAGTQLRHECSAVLAAGPAPLSAVELALARYTLTDQLDDLAGGADEGVLDAIVIEVWRRTAELLLATAERWSGSAKWLIRELQFMDEADDTRYAAALHTGLHAALAGDPARLMAVAEQALDVVGGRLWSGFYLQAETSTTP